MFKNTDKIQGKLQSIMAIALKLDKTSRKFGTDKNLSHAEVHLVEIIGDNRNLSVSDIARLLEVTKGAVSQRLKRLEKKEIIIKRPDPSNHSRSIVRLTSKGNISYWEHKHWHETMDGGFSEYLETLAEKDAAVVFDFLDKFEQFLDIRLKSPE